MEVSFEQYVRDSEKVVFPKCFNNVSQQFTPPEGEGSHYIYYPPSWYAEHKLLDRQMLEKLRSGGTILSIGAGPAYLERFLISEGVSFQSITLCDFDDTHMPKNFKRYTFDASGKVWPDFDGTFFDFVIFPESFAIINGIYSDLDVKREDDFELCTPEEFAKFNEKPMRCKRNYKPFNAVSAERSGAIHLFQRSLDILKPDGEIRSTSVYLNETYSDPLAWLAEVLETQHNATLIREISAGVRIKLRNAHKS